MKEEGRKQNGVRKGKSKMRFEIKKDSELIGTKLKKKKKMLKSYAELKTRQTVKKNEVEFVLAESGAWLQASPSESDSGNVRYHPHVTLGSLFEDTCNPQSVAVPSRLAASGIVLTPLPCWLFISTRPRCGSSNI